MPIMQGNTSVTTVTESANVLAGLPYEFVRGPCTVQVAATIPIAAVAGDVVCSLLVNNVAVVQGSDLPNKSPPSGTAEAYPVIPDDTLVSTFVPPGVAARLILRFRNPSATTRIVRWRVDIR